ncbi:MAG: DUF6391 domain-containing protein [Synergistales bacterium]|nr:DUF6391 domain-containing protein [Synergistales bacterium]
MYGWLLLLLVLLVMIPWFGVALLFFLLFFFLLFIPLGFAASSFIWLIVGPKQLLSVLTNRRVRQNHALEHATATILERRYGVRVSGLAYREGFTVKASLPAPEVVADTAALALRRLQRGERELAIHPKCGTTLVVVNILSALVFVTLLLVTGQISILTVAVALLVAHLVGPLASAFVQRYVTTLPDVEDVRILGIEPVLQDRRRRRLHVMGYAGGQWFVRTQSKNERYEAAVVG